MFIPFISESRRLSKRKQRRELERRKGGGGKGGGSSSSGGGKGGGAGSGTSSGIRQQNINSGGGRSQTVSSYGQGGGPITTISTGSFAGRQQGGGTRGQVYGTSAYGSGYPYGGSSGRGVGGAGFPFFFWPVAWGGIGLGGGAYLHNNEYGRPDNSSRPGGVMTYAVFPASSGNTTFRVVADNTTVASLITDVKANCSSSVLKMDSVSSAPLKYDDSDSKMPQPESTVQYYRASSVSLTLDGYNNSAAFKAAGTPDDPIPSYVDRNLLTCLNFTIGAATPLVEASGADLRWATPNVGLLALFWVLYHTFAL